MKRKMLIIIVCLILTILLVSSPLQASEKLQIRIWTDKDTFLVKEPILVNYEIKNITDSAICFTFDNVKEFFNIKDQLGKGYSNNETGDYIICPDTIHPNEALKGNEDIDSRYNITEPGEYTCFNDFSGCKSNVVKIKVKNPVGDEKKALDIYLEAQKLHWCKDKDPKKWEQAFYKYLQLADQYPKSVYAPMSLYTALLKAHVIEDKGIVIAVCKNLIEKYPESNYVDYTFLDLIENYKILGDKVGAMDYLKELIKRYPNTRTSKGAEYWLEKIEKQEFK